jgi:hypothetical protein
MGDQMTGDVGKTKQEDDEDCPRLLLEKPLITVEAIHGSHKHGTSEQICEEIIDRKRNFAYVPTAHSSCASGLKISLAVLH